MEILPASFYRQDTKTVARALLGTLLVHEKAEGTTIGRIVETEAYLGINDEASHAYRGMTRRNAPMFGNPGHAYIYFIYGMYYCINVVTAQSGVGEAILLRALQPVEGISLMEKRRQVLDPVKLCNGPGKLVLAMGITKDANGHNLRQKPLYIAKDKYKVDEKEIGTSTRVGITKAVLLPLRFYIKDSSYVSKHV